MNHEHEYKSAKEFLSEKITETSRTFILEIRYPESDSLLSNAANYLQKLIKSDMCDDVERWVVNVKEIDND